MWMLGRGPTQAPAQRHIGWARTTSTVRPGDTAFPPCAVWLSVAAPLHAKPALFSKRLSKENHFWQPLGNGRSPLTCSSAGICYGYHCPLLPSPCCVPASENLPPCATVRDDLYSFGFSFANRLTQLFPHVLLCLLLFWPRRLEIRVLERSLPERS